MMKKMLIAVALGSTLLGGAAFAGQAHMGGGMFQRADTDGDGAISRTEFLAQAEQRFARLDKNGDARLSGDELAGPRGMAGRGPGGGLTGADADKDGTVTKAEFLAQAAKHFADLDADHDGTISADEMKAMMARMRTTRGGPGMMPGAADRHAAMMARVDTDHDGRISRDEMRAQADARFAKLDANHDGFVDKAEMEAARARMGHHKGRMGHHRHHRAAPGADAPGSDTDR